MKKEKQLYLESTETDIAEVNSQGPGESEFIRKERKSRRDGRKGSRRGDDDAR